MVEVFKTNIDEVSVASRMLELLQSRFPGTKINFDLEDCDKILRVEGSLNFELVREIVVNHGYACSPLD